MVDFKVFDRLVRRVYREDDPWTLEGYLEVFHSYFEFYNAYMGEPHPHINLRQIRSIMDKMPYLTLESKYGKEDDLTPDCYEDLIEKHFNTQYENCDYNVNHFFSGMIREMRFYETLY